MSTLFSTIWRERWQRRDILHSVKLQHYWSLIIRFFSIISRALVGRDLLFCRDAMGVFYSPSQLGQVLARWQPILPRYTWPVLDFLEHLLALSARSARTLFKFLSLAWWVFLRLFYDRFVFITNTKFIVNFKYKGPRHSEKVEYVWITRLFINTVRYVQYNIYHRIKWKWRTKFNPGRKCLHFISC